MCLRFSGHVCEPKRALLITSLLLACFVSSSTSTGVTEKTVNIGSSGTGGATIFCINGGALEDFPSQGTTVAVTTITIIDCPPPARSYAESLRAANYNVAAIGQLVITDPVLNRPIPDLAFEGLKLWGLSISSSKFTYVIRSHTGTFVETDTVNITRGEFLEVTCRGNSLEEQTPLIPGRLLHVDAARVSRCPPPRDSYAAALRALGVDPSFAGFSVESVLNATALRAAHFTGLRLTPLSILAPGTEYLLRESSALSLQNETDTRLNLSNGVRLTLECTGDSSTIEDSSPPLPGHFVTVRDLRVLNCPSPRISYASVLKTLNVNAGLGSFTLVIQTTLLVNRSSYLNESLFRGLSVKTIYLHGFRNKVEEGFLDPVEGLIELNVNGLLLPPMARNFSGGNMRLVSGASAGNFGGCAALQKLAITSWRIPDVTGWLSNCTKLDFLLMTSLTGKDIKRVMVGVRSLTSLMIRDCWDLTGSLKEVLSEAVEVRRLDLSSNQLTDLSSETLAPLTHLRELDLSANDLVIIAPVLQPLQALRILRINRCRGLDFCSEENKMPPMALEQLSLHGTATSRLCFDGWDQLTDLAVTGSRITKPEFVEIPNPRNRSLSVNLRGNPLAALPSERSDHDEIIARFAQVESVSVQLPLAVLGCDCAFGWLARALSLSPRLHVTGLLCAGGEQLDLAPREPLECDMFPCGECTCRRAWRDNSTVAQCSAALDAVPLAVLREPALRELLAPNNSVAELNALYYPDTLQLLDLSNNNVSRANASEASALFASAARRVRLAGNPLVCDCDNQPLVAALHEHRDAVEDFGNLTCRGDGRPLSEVSPEDLCVQLFILWPLLAVLGTAAAALVSGVFAYNRHGMRLKRYLYSRGCCVSCLSEKELDSDRQFDAFISFCHEDDQFVSNNLLPGLEEYTLCVHYRNWVAGDWIPAQIARSIEQSKRTIVVVSKSFLASVWGMFEFRQAHARALSEGRARLVIVLLDDVSKEPGLDDELRSYLATHTYVKWGEPYFWSNLKYALPHNPKPKLAESEVCNSEIALTNC